jgi:hypothetical protein
MGNAFKTFKDTQSGSPAALVERVATVAPKLIQRACARSQFTPGAACVGFARLAYDVLECLDIAADPIDCAVTVWNERFDQWLATGIDHPDAYRHTNDPSLLLQSGVDISGGSTIHCACIVPATQQLIDLSAWQLSRPHRGIQLPSALCLPWNGERARYASAMGRIEYWPWPVGLFPPELRAPPMHERTDWTLTAGWLRPLAKVIAKKALR